MKAEIIAHVDSVINNLRRYGYQINRDLVFNQIYQESRFNKDAVSPAGAKGLTQFMPGTFQEIYYKTKNFDIEGLKYLWDPTKKDPFNYKTSVAMYFYYMLIEIPKMLEYYGYDLSEENHLRAYNAGIGNTLKSKAFVETNNYVSIILGQKWSDHLNENYALNLGSKSKMSLFATLAGVLTGIFLIK